MSLARAVRYAEQGYSVLAIYRIIDGRCACGAAECRSPGKHPFKSKNGVYCASSDPAVVRRRFALDPLANIAIAIGEGPFAEARVLDIDVKHGGHTRLAQLEATHGSLPRTPTQRTGSGAHGRHFVFGPFPGASYLTKLVSTVSGIELLGRGRYFVVDDSVTAGPYEWIVPMTEPIASAPAWLVALATPRTYEQVLPYRPTSVGDARKRASAYLAKCDAAVSGQGGHSTTFRVAMNLVLGFNLGADEAFWLLAREYNHRCRPPWSLKDLRRKVDQAHDRGRMGAGSLLAVRR